MAFHMVEVLAGMVPVVLSIVFKKKQMTSPPKWLNGGAVGGVVTSQQESCQIEH